MKHKAKAIRKKGKIPPFAEWLVARPLLTELTFTALTVLFGMQILRVLVTGMFWVLGNQMGWGATQLGLIGFLIFIAAFLAGPLSKAWGNQRLVVATACGIGIARLFMQVWWGEPLFNFSLALAGTLLFVIFLPACIENARRSGGPAVSHFALGLLVGLALDTAINGAFGTYDTIWQVELLPMLVTLLLLLAQFTLLAGIALTSNAKAKALPRTKTSGISIARALPWLAIGPFLFLQLVVFQNIPRVATLTNWPLPMAFGLTLLAQLAGLAAATWLIGKAQRTLWPWALGAGILLTGALVLGYQKPAVLTALLLVAGQVLISMLIVIILTGIEDTTGKAKRSNVSVANGLGIAMLLIFILAYYAVYDINLPYANTRLEPIAGFIVAICGIGGSALLKREKKADLKAWAVPILALILLVLPIAGVIFWRAPKAVAGQGFPVYLMTYNLNNGVNTKGHLDLEAIAQVIENNNPDIVALQEVPRGWLISGRVDMLSWLSQRLRLPYVFGPTADPFCGNAILSRYPILAYTRHDLPPRDLPTLRGFTTALIDLGKGERLKVIVTNLHHIEGDTDIRKLQSQAILDFWRGNDRTVLLGDLNAEPNEPEITLLREAEFLPQKTRLVDVAAGMDIELAYTYASDNPYRRIDYIWISSDLGALDAYVPLSTASSHLPVVAMIVKGTHTK